MTQSDHPQDGVPGDDSDIDLTARRTPAPRDLMDLLGGDAHQFATQAAPQLARAYGGADEARPAAPPLAPWLSADFHRPRHGAPLPLEPPAPPVDRLDTVSLLGSQAEPAHEVTLLGNQPEPMASDDVEPILATADPLADPLLLLPAAADRPNLLARLREQVSVQLALRRHSAERESDDTVEVVSGMGAPAWIPRRRGLREIFASLRPSTPELRSNEVVTAAPVAQAPEEFHPQPAWDQPAVALAAAPSAPPTSSAVADTVPATAPTEVAEEQWDMPDDFEPMLGRVQGFQLRRLSTPAGSDSDVAPMDPRATQPESSLSEGAGTALPSTTGPTPEPGVDFEEFHPVPAWDTRRIDADVHATEPEPQLYFDERPLWEAHFIPEDLPASTATVMTPEVAGDPAETLDVDRRSRAWLTAQPEPEVTQVEPEAPAQSERVDVTEPVRPLNHERSSRPTARFPHDALRTANGTSPLSAPRDQTGRDRSLHFVPTPAPSRRRPVRHRGGRLQPVQRGLGAAYHAITHLPLPTLQLGSDRQWRRTVGIDRRAGLAVAVAVVMLLAGVLTGHRVSGTPTGAVDAVTTHTPAAVHHAVAPSHPLTRLQQIPEPLISTPTPAPPTETLSLPDPYKLGDGAQGDTVQSVVYGIHPNDFRTVIQLSGDSSPATVIGLENPTTLVVVINNASATSSVGSIPKGQEVVSATEQTTSTAGQIVYFFTLASPITAANISQYYLPSPERLVIDLS